jgi:hypothetical protein
VITLSLEGVEDIQRRLAAAPLSVKRRVVGRLAKEVIKRSKARTRDQMDVDGTSFAPHARGRRRKMLTRLVQNLSVLWSDDKEALIGFRNTVQSQIGAKQQFGFVQTFNPGDRTNDGSRRDLDYYQKPATRRQARALLDAGYKVRQRGGAHRTPTMKWITENLTIARAGMILHALRATRASWQTVLPPRAFLGVAAADIIELTNIMLTEAQAAIEQGQ